MPQTHASTAALYVIRGRVESRRVLRPTAEGPRMEISFSGAVDSAVLGAGSGAFTFIAQPLADTRLRWIGHGILLLAEGNVSARSHGWGQRSGGLIRYRGDLQLRPHSPALEALGAHSLVFDYTQDLQTLAAHFVARAAHTPPPWAGIAITPEEKSC
jgi:hypothetical protein